jgi:nicotinamidase-related amidase
MLNQTDTVLCVIDLQDGLLPKIRMADEVMARAIKLIRFARLLEIPILWTEQYPKGLGPTNAAVAKELEGLKPIAKVAFGCFGAPEFVGALKDTGRKQPLVAGIEAHVCVMQTVLSALSSGYEVYVPNDAVSSRHEHDYNAGLARMQVSGATIVTTEMAIFEILRAAGTPEFKKVLPLIKE